MRSSPHQFPSTSRNLAGILATPAATSSSTPKQQRRNSSSDGNRTNFLFRSQKQTTGGPAPVRRQRVLPPGISGTERE
ncbi:unnamed protein product [Cuscuta campestris]|uniref:Uncharacterized protein n=1 Tax=Cuscuta campestris TaxID=132261 RepID=A0A484MPD5_9ASTE|nr:unnamed protein product [Cuscuta campestris]